MELWFSYNYKVLHTIGFSEKLEIGFPCPPPLDKLEERRVDSLDTA